MQTTKGVDEMRVAEKRRRVFFFLFYIDNARDKRANVAAVMAAYLCNNVEHGVRNRTAAGRIRAFLLRRGLVHS